MWIKSKAILLSVLFVCLSVALLSGQSAKDTMIESLTTYQIKLQSVQKQIRESKQKITDSQTLIDNLQAQLTDSKNNSQIAIDALKKQLTESNDLLTKQRANLMEQETTFNQLSTDLKKLNASYVASHKLNYILGGLSIIMGGYIGGHIAGLW